ncbi:hypothetical protein C8R45DRAFT_1115746 [Mycena sanguinolenta]|nr:hypothetical protein C8R45DRAFT_1115746 [Mycena sanguinolenta]
MAFNMTDPRQRQLAINRLAVGVGPVLGRQAASIMKQIGRARLEELQLRRDAASRHGLSQTSAGEAASDTLPPEVMQGIKASLSPNRPPFVLPAVTRRERKKRGQISRDLADEETVELAEKMLQAFKAGLGDPFDLWRSPPVVDSSSSEDEWDPNGGLPYCPRPHQIINKRVANALTMISQPLGQLQRAMEAEDHRLRCEKYRPWPHAKLAMEAVLGEVVAVGTVKKLLERDEIGPAPHGFGYIQVNDEVYLVSEDGKGSMVYIAEAHRVQIR